MNQKGFASAMILIIVIVLAFGTAGYFIFMRKTGEPQSVVQPRVENIELQTRSAIEKVLATSSIVPKNSKLLSLSVDGNKVTLDFNKDIMDNGQGAFEDVFQQISNALHPIIQGTNKDPRYPIIDYTVLIEGVPLDTYLETTKKSEPSILPKLESVSCNKQYEALDNPLAISSRQEIIKITGFSSDYFSQHFSLVGVANEPGPHFGATTYIVKWDFCLNEYFIEVVDRIAPDGAHFIQDLTASDSLIRPVIYHPEFQTHDIEKTIAQDEAFQKLARCIGEDFKFAQYPPAVYLGTADRKFKVGEKFGLFLTGQTIRETTETITGKRYPRVSINIETGECAKWFIVPRLNPLK